MKLINLFLLALIVVNGGCQGNHGKKPESERAISDTIVKEVPEWYEPGTPKQKLDRTLFSLLNLDPLENGFDSLQIRIWIDCGYYASNVIVIEKNKSKWTATFYSFTPHFDEDYNVDVRNLETQNKSPKSGWEYFSANLLKTGLTELPDFTKIDSGYFYPTDASRTYVEIGTQRKYRLYEYPELGLNRNIPEGPAKLNQALQLIESEFDFKRPCQNDSPENATLPYK